MDTIIREEPYDQLVWLQVDFFLLCQLIWYYLKMLYNLYRESNRFAAPIIFAKNEVKNKIPNRL